MTRMNEKKVSEHTHTQRKLNENTNMTTATTINMMQNKKSIVENEEHFHILELKYNDDHTNLMVRINKVIPDNMIIPNEAEEIVGHLRVLYEHIIRKVSIVCNYTRNNHITMNDINFIEPLIDIELLIRRNTCSKCYTSCNLYPCRHLYFSFDNVKNYQMKSPIFTQNIILKLVSNITYEFSKKNVYISDDVLIFMWKLAEYFVEESLWQ